MQKTFKPTFYLTYRNEQPTVLEGTPLGFIDRKQFYLLYNDPIKFVRKLLSCSPKTLDSIAAAGAAIKNHRFVFKTSGENCEKQLFVSQELNFITAVDIAKKKVVDLELIDLNNKPLYIECRHIG